MAGTKSTQLSVFLVGATDMQNWVACFGFFLVVSLKWTMVSLHPLGLEVKGVGIHQRQPNYLPVYNGIFSIHALNFSSSTADTPVLTQQLLNSTSISEEHEEDENPGNQESKLFPEDGTSSNEVDFENRLEIGELTTFPQLHVVTQTIGAVPDTNEDGETTEEIDDETPVQNETITELTHTDSESLLEGSEDSEEPPETEDLFDRLMRTIQGHWLEFVGKMKMSVLDVWKSISSHMMERLENFATNV